MRRTITFILTALTALVAAAPALASISNMG